MVLTDSPGLRVEYVDEVFDVGQSRVEHPGMSADGFDDLDEDFRILRLAGEDRQREISNVVSAW